MESTYCFMGLCYKKVYINLKDNCTRSFSNHKEACITKTVYMALKDTVPEVFNNHKVVCVTKKMSTWL